MKLARSWPPGLRASLPIALPTAAVGVSFGLLAAPMGFAIAPSMSGDAPSRAATGALLADASFAIGHRGGRFDISAIRWAAPLQYLSWLVGTAPGAGAIGDPDRWGLDVLFPVFYLSLLAPELDRRRGRLPLIAAALAAAITMAITPLAPAGIHVLAASAAALLGLRR